MISRALSGTDALQFLHEAAGWIPDTDPYECRINGNTIRNFIRKGWVMADKSGCWITLAGHRAFHPKPDPKCHGCTHHFAKMAESSASTDVVIQ